MAGDGMEDAHRATWSDREKNLKLKREAVERCSQELADARVELRDAERGLGIFRDKVHELEALLEDQLK